VSGGFERIALPRADVLYQPGWLPPAVAGALMQRLVREIPWTQHQVRMFGRELPSPRLSAWIGDADAVYTYSRVRHQPAPWTPALAQLRERLQVELGARFNSVLANRYRDGRDSMGWHADDEPELGPEPLIASISLGAVRRMRFRARDRSAVAAIDLADGSLLLMGGRTQTLYQHAVDKTRADTGERINLTFRWIHPWEEWR
jgi:alkylated DNA repair dioxygenase AlkB